MIRLRVEATTDPARVHPDLASHQAEVIRRCPYLGPSVERGLTVWSAVEAAPSDEPALLTLLVDHAEQVRADRRSRGPLVCHNIALFGPADDRAARRLMERPVWLARNLYAPVQVVVDRFWIGAGRRPGQRRSPLPHVPVPYFMVRCGIAHRDLLFPADRAAASAVGWHVGSLRATDRHGHTGRHKPRSLYLDAYDDRREDAQWNATDAAHPVRRTVTATPSIREP